jgi:hypothetical protein
MAGAMFFMDADIDLVNHEWTRLRKAYGAAGINKHESNPEPSEMPPDSIRVNSCLPRRRHCEGGFVSGCLSHLQTKILSTVGSRKRGRPACRTGKMSVFENSSRVCELGLRVQNAGCLFVACSE